MKQHKKTGFSHVEAILIILVIAVIGALGYVFYGHYMQKPDVSSNKTTENIPIMPEHGSVLAYRVDASDKSNSKVSLIGLDGKTIASLTTKYSQGFYTRTGEDGFLVVNDKTSSNLSILSPNGTISPIPESLNISLQDIRPALIGKSTLLSIQYSSDFKKEKFVKTDLIKGTETTIFEATAAPGPTGQSSNLLDIATMSSDGNTAYILSGTSGKTVIVDTVTTEGISLITVDLLSGKYDVKPLPGICYGTCAISKDGNMIAYSIYTVDGKEPEHVNIWDGEGLQLDTPHIYNVSTGKDIEVSTKGYTSSRSFQASAYSPDGLYLSAYVNYLVDGANQYSIQIVSVVTGAVVYQINPRGSDNAQVGILGWSGDHSFVYENTDANDWENGPWTNSIHDMDTTTGKISDILKSTSNDYANWYGLINY